MKAMLLKKTAPIDEKPLALEDLPIPQPGPGQILVRISACGICHTELDEIEGRLEAKLPIIPGHEVVGRVESLGSGAAKFKSGDRVGIAWINSSCGKCSFCQEGNENLCPEFRGTGCHADGGYAEYTVVSEDFAYPIPDRFSDSAAAPLLCAGAIGYRALRLTNLRDGQILGLFGFGASAHIVIQIVKRKYSNSKVFVFTRPRQQDHQNLAGKLGADWVGATGETPPAKINCAIDFTPAWSPIVEALRVLEKGGRLVINAIRKEGKDKDSVLRLDYPTHLWLEKEIKSVANITKRDAEEFLPLAAEIPIIPEVQEFKLEEANEALILLKQGKIQGAGVLRIRE
ncbi:MAG: zinc-binding alcohol dehydrogenase family protein [Candidatus Aminicenantes bacterium]|nr:zinc-binding alcohol dehydrogenase family protein [Candidatus Aminicenantes bacterium]NIN92103.1 zinc-binding alcohol dehydrogenase family protein [bacterium]